jgi:phosphoribosyl 1,2-cyclic phosphodiesterase
MKLTAHASGSTGNFYSVSDGTTSLLLEAGLPLKEMQRLTGHTLSSFDACFISHAHKDHSKGAADLANKIGVDIYCSEHTASTFDASTFRMEDRCIKTVKTIEVLAFDVKHYCKVLEDWMPTLGFFLRSTFDHESLVFITDTFYSPLRFDKPTIMAIECNYAADLLPKDIDQTLKDRLVKSHMELETSINLLKANDLSQCREIHLLHLSQGNGDPERFVREVEAATGIATYAAPAWRKR